MPTVVGIRRFPQDIPEPVSSSSVLELQRVHNSAVADPSMTAPDRRLLRMARGASAPHPAEARASHPGCPSPCRSTQVEARVG
jgi:hypothetical protein